MAATFAQGTKIKTTGGSNIAGVHSISGPGMTGDVVDVSDQDTASGFRAYISGLRTGGQVTFDISYTPSDATHQQLITDLKAGQEDNYTITFNSDAGSKTFLFDAIPVGFEVTAPVDGALIASVTLQTTGDVTAPS